MESAYVKKFVRLFLLTAFVFTIAGCGSSGSTASSPESNGTGSIAAKLTWTTNGGQQKTATTPKTQYLAPTGVINIRVFVSAVDMTTIVDNFVAVPGAAGSGTIAGIPAGTGRTIKVWGMDAGGIIRYQGVTNNVTIVAGQVTTVPITMSAPATTASPATGTYPSPLSVTLTASEPATIYYSTSGIEPTTSGTKGPSPLNLTITATTTLLYFAIDSGFAQEQTKSETYTITP